MSRGRLLWQRVMAGVVLVSLLALPGVGRGAAGTTWVAEQSGTSQFLAAVSFSDALNGHAVGEGGTILATTDGGNTWRRQYACAQAVSCTASSPDRLTVPLNAVSFSDASRGHVAGAGGTILATEDGGAHWRLQTSGTVVNLAGIAFADRTHGYVVGGYLAGIARGGTILTTSDGGNTWTERYACRVSNPCAAETNDRITAPFTAVSSVPSSPTSAHVVGLGGIVSTTDGGSTWIFRLVAPAGELRGVSFPAPERGWAVGTGGTPILATADGGATWTPQTDGVNLSAVSFSDAANGRAVGDNSRIRVTTDGGQTWMAEDTGNANFAGVSQTAAGAAHVVGSAGRILGVQPSGASPPSPPQTPVAKPKNGSALVSWQAPSTDGGSSVSSYRVSALALVGVEYTPTGQTVTVGGTATSAVVPGLANGTSFLFDVVAANPAGESGPARTNEIVPRIPWLAQTPLAAPRVGATATALDGPACVSSTRPEWCGDVLVVGGGVAAAELFDPSSGRWRPAGRLAAPRSRHTATLLNDGTVLVVGGQESLSALETAERYNPVSGEWRSAGAMANARYRHTATLLSDGTVLVVGGGFAEGRAAVASAEVYVPDAGTGRWKAAGTMAVPRAAHAAVLVDDGSVLVSGGALTLPPDEPEVVVGATPSPPTASAERFEPLPTGDAGAGTWVPSAPLTEPRLAHSATVLGDGRVLVAGGIGPTGFLKSSEISDAATGLWRAAAPMSSLRAAHVAAVLGGAACEGMPRPAHCGTVVVAGGMYGGGVVDRTPTEVFDPSGGPTGRWAPTGRLVGATDLPAATAMQDGRVLLVDREVAEVFDPQATVSASPPQVLSVDTPYGSSAGGTTLTVRAIGLEDFVAVLVDGNPATGASVGAEATSVTATLPGHAPGTVNVRVVTAAGTSSVHPGAQYRYGSLVGSWSRTRPGQVARTFSTATLLAGVGVLVTGGDVVSAETFDPGLDDWQATGPMGTARFSGHTAIPLAAGRVLVVGGTGPSGTALDATEIYEPGRRSWTASGKLQVGRAGHAAVRLRDGRVLVAGGNSTNGPTRSVEIYDPVDGAWSRANDLPAARVNHTATVLRDGRVLVVGGCVEATSPPCSTALMYEPGRNRWTPAGSLGTHRNGHTASVLLDGRVLVVGGTGPAGNLRSAEIFDPATLAWEPTGELFVPRVSHTASVLTDGSVLIAGGCCTGPAGDGLELAERYDPAAGRWEPAAGLGTGRANHHATLLSDGRVLVSGGESVLGELFSVYTGIPPQIASVEPAGGPTFGGTVVTLRGVNLAPRDGEEVRVRFGDVDAKVLTVAPTEVTVESPAQAQGTVAVTAETLGGASAPAVLSEFTYGAGAWRPAGPMPAAVGTLDGRFYDHTATDLAAGEVLVAGGTQDFALANALRSAALYDPATGIWSRTGSLGTSRFQHTATRLLDGRVLVAGGQNEGILAPNLAATKGGALTSSEVYDPLTARWAAVDGLNVPRLDHTATLLEDGRVLVTGGATSEGRRRHSVAAAEMFDPASGRWTLLPPMNQARVGHTATLLEDGRVLVAGGMTFDADANVPGVAVPLPGNAEPVASAEIFAPKNEKWTLVPEMSVARFSHTASLLPGGEVLVAGGNGGGFEGLASAEVFDPAADAGAGRWAGTGSFRRARGGHTATTIAGGRVLVTGGGPGYPGEEVPGPLASAEIYDPTERTWALTSYLASPRAGHTASLLPDGTVLAAGGYRDMAEVTGRSILADGTERYTPAPGVTELAPASGPSGGGLEVSVNGHGLRGVSEVRFGTVVLPPEAIATTADGALVARAPVHPPGPVQVSVANAGGTSAHLVPRPPSRFTYLTGAGAVRDLTATALGAATVRLSFSAPDDGSTLGPATAFEVRQSGQGITPDNFSEAQALCEGVCRFTPATSIVLQVNDLSPNTTYHFAVRAFGRDGSLGPMSASVAVITAAVDFGGQPGACPAAAVPTATKLAYPAGYSLVGLPAGTVVGADSPLYSWFDAGASGAYAAAPGTEPAGEGRGYWAWFACPRLIELGAGSESVSFPLGAYHASMVGNPSGTSAANVSGHDFVARWDPAANDGAGGYIVSGYREPQRLAVGEGAWAFSYLDTTVAIDPAP
ncbi:MAG TPA: kelch repeat-containing protein [Acidimicrobiales bacterium]|nr:kelch repeat-containing protein [Acidimicrobiales bacterium]